LSAAPSSALAVDINKDGNLDLIVADSSNLISSSSLFLGKGDGTFQPRLTIDTGSFRAAAFVAADFFGDGKMSLAAACPGDNGIAILRGNGDGTFRDPVTYVL